MPPVQEHKTTYEELRKKNREEYQKKRTGVYRYLCSIWYESVSISMSSFSEIPRDNSHLRDTTKRLCPLTHRRLTNMVIGGFKSF